MRRSNRPYVKKPGLHSRIVCGDLIRAVQTESEIAVAHHWGVTPNTVSRWRQALCVPRMTEGSRKLAVALATRESDSRGQGDC